jgi:hypothetical protein
MLFDLNAIRTPLLLLRRRPAGRRLPDLDLNPNRPTVVLAFAYLGTDQRGGEAFFPVGLGGIEPPTSALSVLRSNRLSYSPVRYGDEKSTRPSLARDSESPATAHCRQKLSSRRLIWSRSKDSGSRESP